MKRLATGLLLVFASGSPVPRPAIPQESQAPEMSREDLEAVARYRKAAEGSEDPVDWYNFGTSLLRIQRWGAAREPLLRSAGERKKDRLGTFPRYNYGLATAEAARKEARAPDARRERLLQAREAFRDVLRADPSDEDARWNLELIDRWLQERQQGGGGSGGGSGSSGGGAASQGGRRSQAPEGAGEPVQLGPGEAEALLSAAGRAEVSVRDRLLGRARLRDPVVEKNW
ncbi:MAG: hypothetical protein ACE5HP_11320 [Gemmatimonadota bacterium]